jgi:hypothetical protein
MPSKQPRKNPASSTPAVNPNPTLDVRLSADTGVERGITPRLLSVRQASVYSGATVWCIRSMYWAKELSGFIAGRRLLIDRTSLDAWIDRKLAERIA